ncbi:MAG: tRNA lysidine(34) synthetase TilS [Campylobacteraceae bacterium]
MQQFLENSKTYEDLKKTKNLLAFSGGVDSSALFFILHVKEVPFDIVIVDYNLRASSKDEVAYAQELSKKHNKKIYIKSVHLGKSNFEANARDERYDFFTKIIEENSYETLITAHHLGDKLEWFFMRFTRGAGAVELNGFNEIEHFKSYKIVRPLIYNTKDELLEFLVKNGIKYFVDESNFEDIYERNRWRKNFCGPLLKEYKQGIKNSFKALCNDAKELSNDEVFNSREMYCFKRGKGEIRQIAKIAKFFKIVLSAKQRDEVLNNENCVISGKIAIGKNDTMIFVAPYLQNIMMTKEFKEECRKAKIPLHVRAYMFQNMISPKEIKCR